MAQRKKILFIHHGTGLGGAPLSLLYLVQGLSPDAFEPVVAFLHASEALTLFEEHNISTVGPLTWYDFPHTRIWWFRWYHAHKLLRSYLHTLVTLFFVAPRLYRQQKPAIVHLNTSSLIAYGLAAKWMGIPVVWHIREPLAVGYIGFRKMLVQKCVAYAATRIVSICKHDALPWRDNPKTHVVYNAVPAERFTPALSAEPLKRALDLGQAPTILFVGGCAREKGTLTILKAFQLVLEKIPSARLLIAGTLPPAASTGQYALRPAERYGAQVRHAIEQCKGQVTLLGVTTAIPEAMAAANVVVFPATVGHFARPVIEAGFMKKPVIASRLAPLEELIMDKITGFLLDPYDYPKWGDTLITLLTDTSLASTMGQAGYDYCTQKFSLPKQLSQMTQLYIDVTERKSA